MELETNKQFFFLHYILEMYIFLKQDIQATLLKRDKELSLSEC